MHYGRQLISGSSWLGRVLYRLADRLARPPWLEAGLLLALGGAYLCNSTSHTYPVGYAGLYSLMAELVARQPFPMPSQIPFYGPAGVPFTYPPLGAYLAAFFLGPLHVPLFDYLKWAPPLTTLTALAVLYHLARSWTGDRLKALVAVAAVGSAEITYAFHSTASGMMRAPALAFALAGAHFALRSYSRNDKWPTSAPVAGLFLALTAMTHLAYAAFLVLGILLMPLLISAPSNWLARLKVLAVIGTAGITLSSPWWATVLMRHGPAVLSYASTTHGNLGMLGGSPMSTLREILRWLMPAWLVVSLVVIGQSDRFQVITSGIMIGDSLVDLSRLAIRTRLGRARLGPELAGSLACVSIVLAPLLLLGYRGMQWTPVALSDELLEAAAWIQQSTGTSAHYLYLGEGHDEAEWLPFLARRSPAIGHWGAEWTGDYDRQLALTSDMEACLDSPHTDCLDALIAETGHQVSTLVLNKEDTGLLDALRESPNWRLADENTAFALFHRAQ